ncbi:MAG: 50S ribosomal protein L9 [Thermodesulfobacteria bacterium]|nr:50S ribosomal protein L9 [Thermodesulfobacteriota bacterium]
MEVILNESIESLGKAGDIVNVSDGYARNYLIPKGIAIVANKKNLVQIEKQRAAILERAAKIRQEFEALAEQLEKLELEIPVKVGEEEKLYGSVTTMDIAKAIEDKGYQVDRKKIVLPEPIKALGEYEVPVKLSPDVTATVKVKVVPADN